MLMILVSLEDASTLGIDPEEISIRFLEEKLNSALETKIIFEKNHEIAGWAENLENEIYADEAVILFENICLLPQELGYETITIDNKVNTYRCMYDDVCRYGNILSQYGQIYYYDDHYNMGNRYRLSNVYIRCEYNVLGKNLYSRLELIIQYFRDMEGDSVLVLGGDMTDDKLMMLQSIRNLFNKIYLVGGIGNSFAKWSSGYVPQITKPKSPMEIIYRSILDPAPFPFSHTMIDIPRDVCDSEDNQLIVKQYDGEFAEQEEIRLKEEKEIRDKEREEREREERERKLKEEEGKKKGGKDNKQDMKKVDTMKTMTDSRIQIIYS